MFYKRWFGLGLTLLLTASLGAISANGIDLSVRLELTAPGRGMILAGDHVRLIVHVMNEGESAADSIVVAALLPEGLKLNDPFWQPQQASHQRVIPRLLPGATLALTLACKVDDVAAADFLTIGVQLAHYAAGDPDSQPGRNWETYGTEDDEVSLKMALGKIFASRVDTCAFLRDTSLEEINQFLATREEITAGLSGPVDLSPTGPFLLSGKQCAAFNLKVKKKKKDKKRKDKCSCFRYYFDGPLADHYPEPYDPDGKRLQQCVPLHSAGRKGDTITIAVRSVDGKPLKRIMLTNRDGEILDAVFDSPTFSYEQVLENDSAVFNLYLQTTKIFLFFPRKQLAFLTVIRKPRTFSTSREGDGTPSPVTTSATQVLSRNLLRAENKQLVWSTIVLEKWPGGSVLSRIEETTDLSGERVLSRDTTSRDSCAGDFIVQPLAKKIAHTVWVAVDTLLGQPVDRAFSIAGKRNPAGTRLGIVEISVPLQLNLLDPPARDSLIALAYWIGVGATSTQAYALLEEEVPPEWSQPGITAPLAAFGLTHPVVLPGLATGNARFQRDAVRYDFLTGYQKERFVRENAYVSLIKRLTERPNYGLLEGDALKALFATSIYDRSLEQNVLRFYFAARNEHEVNTYPVHLKIVAYYQVKAPTKIWKVQTTLP